MAVKRKPAARRKPSKPYKDFPLFPHATKRWAKKIRGKFHYFGPWEDADGALRRYLDQKDDLHAGRTPRHGGDDLLELRDVANRFLTAKLRKVDAGELKRFTFDEYYRAAHNMVGAFSARRVVDDLNADDFGQYRATLAKRYGPGELSKQIQIVRSIFKFAYESGHIDKPMRFGPEFTRPSRKHLRQARRANGTRMLEAAQIRVMLEQATVPLKAMILLGINCGWGNTDVSELLLTALDLDAGTADYPRPKTAIDRKAILWPETIEAVKRAYSRRPKPKDSADAGLVFITQRGHRWIRYRDKDNGQSGAWVDSVGLEFNKLLGRNGFKRHGLGFYALRHTFRTVADEVGDRPAIDLIMGHENVNDMSVHYRERISDDRLRRVTNHVREWIFGS